jgi:hypothetical protein
MARGESYSAQPTSDGGFIAVGETGDFSSYQHYIYLIKTDMYGDTVFVKTYGTAFSGEIAVGMFVRQTSDSGFIVTGYTNVYNPYDDTFLLKTDSNGNVTWIKYFNSVGNRSKGQSVEQTIDGGYILTGSADSSVFLTKTDANGIVLWKKLFYNSTFVSGLSVQQTSDGGYILTGGSDFSDTTGADVYLIKTDAVGTIIWSKNIGGSLQDEGRCVQQTIDGGYIVLGNSLSFGGGTGMNIYLIKTDASGNVVWTKTIGGTSYDFGYSLQQTMDGGYVITGTTYILGINEYYLYLIKTNNSGVLQWSKYFEGATKGYSVRQAAGQGYIICGVGGPYAPDITDTYVIKTDSLGNGGCFESEGITTESNVVSTITSSIIIVDSVGGTKPSLPIIVGNGGKYITTLCSSSGINESQINNKINIYPNPTNGNISIDYTLNTTDKGELLIYDIAGKLINNYPLNASTNKMVVNIETLSNGIYLYKVVVNNRAVQSDKLVIIK